MAKQTEGRPQLFGSLVGWFGWPGREADHCFLPTAEVRNARSYNSTFSHSFVELGRFHTFIGHEGS